MSDKEWLGELLDTCEEEPFFEECDEIVEDMLFDEVGICRIFMFFDEEVGEFWEDLFISISWMSETLRGSAFFGKVIWTGGREVCIGRHIMGSILLQEDDR